MVNHIQDCEKQLLGSWIIGYNREHIREFDYFLFFSELFIALSEMPVQDINMVSIAKKANVSIADIAQIVSEYWPSMYDGAFRLLKMEKIKAMLAAAGKNPADIAEQIEAITKEMERLQATHIRKPVDMCETYHRELERRKVSQPLKYGLPALDYSTGGLRSQELTVIAARPSIGKTSFALQTAFNLAVRDKNVLFFSLEMSGSQLMERIACRQTDIKHERLKTPGQMDDKDNTEFENFIKDYRAMVQEHLHIIESVSCLSDVRRYIEHYRPSVVFIDQLSQLRENRKFNSFREQFTFMTNSLKSMSMTLDIPIVLLAQITRVR